MEHVVFDGENVEVDFCEGLGTADEQAVGLEGRHDVGVNLPGGGGERGDEMSEWVGTEGAECEGASERARERVVRE